MSIFREGLLRGQTAVITGGSSGINLGIAHRFAEHGANLVLVARKPDKLAQAQEALSRHGTRVLTVSADVRDYAAVAEGMASAQAELGPFDIVIAGAAGNFLAPAAAMSANAFAAVISIDLLGTFNIFRATFEHLRKPGARLLVISAPQAVMPMPMQTHACAAKAGIESLVRTLALEWGREGVRINGISPGFVEGTEGFAVMTSDGVEDAMRASLPIPRFESVGELADMALVLVSPVTGYMTGHIVALDGGTSLLGGSYAVGYTLGRQQG